MLLQKLRGKIAAHLVLKSPPKFLRKELLREFAFANPAYEQIERFSPWGYVPASVPREITLAKYIAPNLFVPRGIELDRLSARSRRAFRQIKWQDRRTNAEVAFPQFLVKLNKEQDYLFKSFQTDLAEQREGFGCFLYVSPTGSGKTILMLRLAKRIRQRTLIIFATEQIKRAWFTGIELAFGYTQKEIGMIQQKKWKIGATVTLASISTLARRKDRWAELFQTFGTLIVDEADTVTSPSLYKFIAACPARYVIGATATDRGDKGRNHHLRACFGATRGKVKASTKDTETSMAVRRVELVYTKFKHIVPSSLLDWNDLSDHLMTDEDRNRLIIHHVIKDYRAGERILLVTKRLAHVELLMAMLKERGVRQVTKITGETNANSLRTEKLLEGVLSRKVPIVVATIAAIKRGANLNPLSVLHVGMPTAGKNTLEQLIGRVRRRAAGKTECRVTYYLDGNTPYLLNLFKRAAVPVFRRLKIKGYENLYIS